MKINIFYINDAGLLRCAEMIGKCEERREQAISEELKKITQRIWLIPGYSSYEMVFLKDGWCKVKTAYCEMMLPVSWVLVSTPQTRGNDVLEKTFMKNAPGVLSGIVASGKHLGFELPERIERGTFPLKPIRYDIEYKKSAHWHESCSYCRKAAEIMDNFVSQEHETVYGSALFSLHDREGCIGFNLHVIMPETERGVDAPFYFKKDKFNIERIMNPVDPVEHATRFVQNNFGKLFEGNILGVIVNESYIQIQTEYNEGV